ncbi:hypothetical protein H4R33_004925 [Dimargaris cristalligena]|nr:hypothetical protein H4R33_004925 [Dimargaris cristalligena]
MGESNLPNAPLSERVRANLSFNNPLWKIFSRVGNNHYHPANNPDGILNLGVAENKMMRGELVLRLVVVD